MPGTKAARRLKLRITASAQTILRSGHPWLFAASISEQNRAGQPGELAVIYDRKDRFLAVGLFDPDSPIRVRMLHVGKPVTIDDVWWSRRLQAAVERRRGLFQDDTSGFRLVNGESDGWPGLVLDKYDTTLVMKVYTAGWLPRLAEIAGLIRKELEPERLVLRLSRNIQSSAAVTWQRSDGEILYGAKLSGPVMFQESGLRFEAAVLRGQKTGFFLDQRENRRKVEWLSRGRDVLNAFSFTGGFSLYAARGGARSVTDLDISGHALAGTKRNFRLNESESSIPSCRHETIQADAFEWLDRDPTRKFGLVILDPPSLAKRESERGRAMEAYRRLAAAGIAHLEPDGILLACSCSAHVSAQEFFQAVRTAAAGSRRKFCELETTGHAADHPAGFKEAEYLKAIYARMVA